MKARPLKKRASKLFLSIIIPVYNEPKNIIKTLERIKKDVPFASEIIVVYDFNTDTTVPVLNRIKKQYRTLHIIKNSIAKGPSGAIRTGIKSAKSPRILVMMADLCDDTSQVKQMVDLVPKRADIVCPSRYAEGGKQELNSYFKVGLPRTAGFLLKVLTGIKTSDPTNSYKLYSKRILDKMTLSSTVSFSVTLEIVTKAHLLGAKIIEIPTVWRDRQHGKTKFKLLSSLTSYTPWFLLGLAKNRVFKFPNYLLLKFI